MATLVLSGWFASRALPSVLLQGQWSEASFGFFLDNNVGFAYDLVAGLVVVTLVLLDYFSFNPSPVGQWLRMTLDSYIVHGKQKAGDASQQANIGSVSGHGASVTINQGLNDSQVQRLLDQIDQNKPIPTEHNASLNAEIDVARDYTRNGEPRIAIAFLEKLWQRSLNQMSAHERFRVQANLGHAYDALGEHAKAAEYFFKAKSHEPDEEQAQSLEAFAYFALGNNAKALECASGVINRYSHAELAWAVRVRAAPRGESMESLEQSIPEPLRWSGEVLLALAWAAINRELYDKAETFARQGMEHARISFPLRTRWALC